MKLTDDAVAWTMFAGLYSEVIEECPLILRNHNIVLKHIRSLTVKKIRMPRSKKTPEGNVMFGTTWTLDCKNPKHSGKWTMYFVVRRASCGPSSCRGAVSG